MPPDTAPHEEAHAAPGAPGATTSDFSRVGIAFFDNPSGAVLNGGWCSVAGEPARNFSSAAGELSPHVLWITNLDFNEHIENQLSGTRNIRNSGYFRLALKNIGSEIGVYETTLIPDAVQSLSGVASRIVALAQRACPDIRVNGFSLTDAIYSHLGLADERTDPAAHYQKEFQSAFQEHSVVTSRRGGGGEVEVVRFIPNRVLHAEAVLSYPIPDGNLHVTPGAMTVAQFLELENPALAEVSVDNSCVERPELLAFGAQYSGTGVMRNWAAQPEVYFMAQSGSKIRIHNVLSFDSSASAPTLPAVVTNNALIRTAYSAGIFADNHLAALMSKRRKSRVTKGARNPYFFPSRAVYLRSVDRMLSFAVAQQLAERGLRVTGYGLGAVNAMVTEQEMPEALEIGADLGFAILAANANRFGRDFTQGAT